jgi:5'-deoxynucleotidase YfbR-like HD superfamily hydrolase
MSWIRTYTGRRFDPLNPRVEDVDPADIGHALSNICRYTGHTSTFYSVAQHSVIVSEIVEELGGNPVEQFQGLMHDATEAYMNDISRPLKIQPFMAKYRDYESELEWVIAKRFGLKLLCTERVKKADLIALATETRDLMGDPQDWEILYGVRRLPQTITPYQPAVAKAYFWDRFGQLRRAVGE